MFRFLTLLIAVGVAIYKTVYGHKDSHAPATQTTNQPVSPLSLIPVRRNAPKVQPKPEVLFGEPLTDEEWEQIQRSDRTYIN